MISSDCKSSRYQPKVKPVHSARETEELNDSAIINAMGAYNESMMKAGVMLGGDGLTDAAQGAVVEFTGEAPIVTDGPYGEVQIIAHTAEIYP